MPDYPCLTVTNLGAGTDCFLDGLIDGMELVVAGDDLGRATLVVVLIGDEVANQVQDAALGKDPLNEDFQFNGAFRRFCLAVDRSPDLEPFTVG
jgi:hypothetical protein